MGTYKAAVSLILALVVFESSSVFAGGLDLPSKPLTSGWSGGKGNLFMNMSKGISPVGDWAVITYWFRPGLDRSGSNGALVSFGTSEKCNDLTPAFNKNLVNSTVVINGIPLKANRNCGESNANSSSADYSLVTDFGIAAFEEIMRSGSDMAVVFDGGLEVAFQNADGKIVNDAMSVLEGAK